MRVIRCGGPPRREKMKGISAQDVACLEGFWSLERQMGIRKAPEDDFLSHIPKITLAGKAAGLVEDKK